MSKTTTAILVKLLLTIIAGWITLGAMDGNTIGWILTFAVIGTILNYLFGDLYILPSYGNITASIGDGVMAAVVAYVLDVLSANFDTRFSTLIILAVLVAVVEYFFHRYLIKSDEVAP
ncbi:MULTISPECIES: DUF2512 family protein [Clostridium]|uniref:DUF2512 family protein n=2 Tax=Clostridium TaxID=1485 RepID=A0A151AS11_9CLOT|nr:MULTISPECIES: DUF2512 family protein [Clostridium]KYH30382.1 hypothetical protein CLCOL_03280 [Clostridium colicanis DSM 13634]PRR76459.1 hypothetical protein CPAL_01300 [Clostridium thermopalmarium DSM 5974]PVZ28428.1 uncharacterized protein DUF2512 [Clostridium thermopalmarium DSM 5974]